MLTKVSIIIPIYNVEQFIEDCIKSVVNQDYSGSLECILVDDCGQDNSMQVAERYIQDYQGPIEFRVVHHEKNRGLSASRNTGFDASKGDYVLFLDSDDELYPGAISALVGAQKRTGAVVTMANWNIIETGKIISCPGGVYKNEVTFDDLHALDNLPSLHGVTQNKLIQKDFWIENNLYQTEGVLFEDNLWSFKLLSRIRKGQAFCITPAITYIYKMRDNSIVHSLSIKHIRSYIKSVEIACVTAKETPQENQWYAIKRLEDFKRTALLNAILKVDGKDTYWSIYRYSRQFNIVGVLKYLSIKEISCGNKLFYLHNLLPCWIGGMLQYSLLKLQMYRSGQMVNTPKLKIDLNTENLYD